ncbi:GNAT family N-acetyltransferase [Neobacillus mesonae]|nr:GNAT family N-acetyltransferase [Neobacillus mesonae]
MESLDTERLCLRDFLADDFEEVHRYSSDPRVTTYTFWGPNDEDQTYEFLRSAISEEQAEPRLQYTQAIVLKETQSLIGGCGITLSGSNAEIGYSIHPDYWGKGYATEAAKKLLYLGFKVHNVHRIYATCRPANIGSMTVMKKLGMTKEGQLREHVWHNGKYHDSLLFSILADEYAEQSTVCHRF